MEIMADICAICCVPYTRVNLEEGNELLTKLRDYLDLNGDQNLESLACENCVISGVSLWEAREVVNDLEERVRGLQLEILRMQREVIKLLGELEGKIRDFKEGMRRMEETMRESSFRNLDKFYGEGSRLKDAIEFRGRFLSGLVDGDSNGKWGLFFANELKEVEGVLEDFCEDSKLDEQVDSPHDDVPDSSGGSDEDNDDDHSFVTKRSNSSGHHQKSQLKRRRNLHKTSVLSKLPNSATMSLFKRNLITRTILRCQNQKKGKRYLYSDVDCLRTYKLTYDPTSDTLKMAGIQLTITSEENDNSVECMKCGTKLQASTGSPGDIDRMIYNHVLAYHLKLFQCPYCPKNLNDIRNFQLHLAGHKNGKDGNVKLPKKPKRIGIKPERKRKPRVVSRDKITKDKPKPALEDNPIHCNICGKPLKNIKCLKNHKWLHLSQEEKQEAIQNGEVPPVKYYQNPKEKIFQCRFCGKRFAKHLCLQQHERIHQEPQFMCQACGKQFHCPSNYYQHQRYVCYPGKKEGVPREHVLRFQCDVCLMKFRTASVLKKHKRKHSDDKPFPCEVCGKHFKSKEMAKTHSKTVHSDERPFFCGKGCGARYKKRTHANRHQKNCKYEIT